MSDSHDYKNDAALEFHKNGKPGKIAISPTKPLISQRDLSLAYSPGVAAPCLEIYRDPQTANDYTAKGNMVAVISNGTAVLGLGNLGALASKPVMEGKSVLFKRFADIDSIDIEVDTEDPEEFINAVKYLGPSWGGINLEDIRAPECFIIEDKLREIMNVPVFHDDQHGTAIITAAGLINAAHLTGRKLEDVKLVVLGAGSAGIACLELVKSMGLKNALLVDRTGVIYEGREDSMNQWKAAHAAKTDARSLEDAMKGADAFYGLAGKGAVTKEMIASMAPKPIVFAMANPDPEITPEEIAEVRDDAIVATGRSDYPNQINNVLGFPYIFRGALDVSATTINEEMKIAAARSLAELARQPVPEEVSEAYGGTRLTFGPDYIIPKPFDPRLIYTVPVAVARAAMDTGVAQKPIEDFEAYKNVLAVRLNPSSNVLSLIFDRLAKDSRTVVFAEGEEEPIIRAAASWQENGYGKAILVGRENKVKETMAQAGIPESDNIEIINAAKTDKNEQYIDIMYKKLQRQGYLRRDCVRLVKNDRNAFASCMLENGDADIMITGLTRSYYESLNAVCDVIDVEEDKTLFGLSMVLSRRQKTIFIADTAVNSVPTACQLAKIAIQSAEVARKLGHEPRVALLSYSNFGNPTHENTDRIKEAARYLEEAKVDFEFDGDIAVDTALNPELLKLYPFSRLTGPANVLIMPALHSANISSKLLKELGGGTIIGPMLSGLKREAQVLQMESSVSDIINMAGLAAIGTYDDDEETQKTAKHLKKIA